MPRPGRPPAHPWPLAPPRSTTARGPGVDPVDVGCVDAQVRSAGHASPVSGSRAIQRSTSSAGRYLAGIGAAVPVVPVGLRLDHRRPARLRAPGRRRPLIASWTATTSLPSTISAGSPYAAARSAAGLATAVTDAIGVYSM